VPTRPARAAAAIRAREACTCGPRRRGGRLHRSAPSARRSPRCPRHRRRRVLVTRSAAQAVTERRAARPAHLARPLALVALLLLLLQYLVALPRQLLYELLFEGPLVGDPGVLLFGRPLAQLLQLLLLLLVVLLDLLNDLRARGGEVQEDGWGAGVRGDCASSGGGAAAADGAAAMHGARRG
jgi:hypothetical protein